MRTLRRHLTYANVTSTICLILVVGGASAFAATRLAKNSVGTAQLRNNAVTGAKVRDGSLSGADVNAASLGEVPTAKKAATATRADSAAKADLASKADLATKATRAVDADSATLAGTAVNLSPPEGRHIVGNNSEPPLVTGWVGANGHVVTFYKDRQGIVHLSGEVTRTMGAATLIFLLPAGYAPSEPQIFPAWGSGDFSSIVVRPEGSVEFHSGTPANLTLNGVTWRAGS